jgi:NAD-dependent dihydropyrimidine dehydrogenase PreA subunit
MITIDADKCTKCSVCSHVCPHEVIKMEGNGVIQINNDKCIDCGACQLNCPVEAICMTKKVGCLTIIIKENLLKNKSGECCC